MEDRDTSPAICQDPGTEIVALWETGKINNEFFVLFSSIRTDEKKQDDKIML